MLRLYIHTLCQYLTTYTTRRCAYTIIKVVVISHCPIASTYGGHIGAVSPSSKLIKKCWAPIMCAPVYSVIYRIPARVLLPFYVMVLNESIKHTTTIIASYNIAKTYLQVGVSSVLHWWKQINYSAYYYLSLRPVQAKPIKAFAMLLAWSVYRKPTTLYRIISRYPWYKELLLLVGCTKLSFICSMSIACIFVNGI
jgi:hypothetical protein